MSAPVNSLDRQIISATQAGLPLVAQPYLEVATQLGITEALLIERLQAMQQQGIIRRIGLLPNHYALGFRGNGMSVWDIPDPLVQQCGRVIGALDYVSHAYHRPRSPPDWPYNLFAMVHGPDRDTVLQKVAEIAALLRERCRSHEVLFSRRILKKTGLRI
ncbi:MAG: Lrp/AsnC family transcriptional regulator [Gammaproteobacteria bacterium]|nr:Lrp/AsnC family transcriptional regulator [Gammaproteobacteria bacterium]